MNFLREGLLWLDTPVRYGTVAWLAFGTTVTLAYLAPAQPRGSRWPGSLLFAAAVLLTLVAFRWPAWFSTDEFNPDESQILAGAITLKEHLLYWKYVDGATHGPVSEYLLVAASWLGAPLNHATARLMGTLLQAVSLLAVWRALGGLAPERVARCGVLPGMAFWAFISWEDFLHYGTELPGITLAALAAWALVKPVVSPLETEPARLRLFFGGFALGMIPLTKLQLVPLGASLGLLVLVLLWMKSRNSHKPGFSRPSLLVLAGAFTPALLLVIYLWTFGLVAQFWHAYVVSGVAYSSDGHHPFHEMPSWFFHFSATAFGFAWFFWSSLLFATLFTQKETSPTLRFARNFVWCWVVIAMFCVLRPSREVAHYLHILVIPLTALCGLVLAGATSQAPQTKWARWWPWTAFAAIALLPQIHFRAFSGNPYVGRLGDNLSRPASAAAEYIHQREQAGDALAMWGWEPKLFVETGLAQGTREAASPYVLSNWPLQRFYLDRYLRDLLNRQPTWFVDAVGPGAFVFDNRATSGHETIPELRDLVSRDYEFLTELDGKRIYRLKAAKGTP